MAVIDLMPGIEYIEEALPFLLLRLLLPQYVPKRGVIGTMYAVLLSSSCSCPSGDFTFHSLFLGSGTSRIVSPTDRKVHVSVFFCCARSVAF